MADSQKKSAQHFDISTSTSSARTTVTSLANGGAQFDITNGIWTNVKYENIAVTQGNTYTLKIYIDEYSGTGTFMIPLRQIDSSGTQISTDTITETGTKIHTFTAEGSTVFLGIYLNNSGTTATATAKVRIMLNEGSQPLPFEPYSSTGWYHSLRKQCTATETIQSGDTIYADGTAATVSLKGNTVQNGTPTPSSPVPVLGVGELVGSDYQIPISINNNTTNIYIGDNPLRKSLDGTAYDTLAADGTLTRRVDSDGSVLVTPVVSQITMPSFNTIDGANTITVDTTVQPSEFTATWTGWHDSTVKEWDGSQWD